MADQQPEESANDRWVRLETERDEAGAAFNRAVARQADASVDEAAALREEVGGYGFEVRKNALYAAAVFHGSSDSAVVGADQISALARQLEPYLRGEV